MNRAIIGQRARFIVVWATLGACGCASSKGPAAPPSASQLKTIGQAYLEATQDLDRAPTGKDELLPYLKVLLRDNPEFPNPVDIFRSTADGEEFVIHWGVDMRDITGVPKKLPVLAYEKTGRDGKRTVLHWYRYPKLVPDEQLPELPFPEDVKNPFK